MKNKQSKAKPKQGLSTRMTVIFPSADMRRDLEILCFIRNHRNLNSLIVENCRQILAGLSLAEREALKMVGRLAQPTRAYQDHEFFRDDGTKPPPTEPEQASIALTRAQDIAKPIRNKG